MVKEVKVHNDNYIECALVISNCFLGLNTGELKILTFLLENKYYLLDEKIRDILRAKYKFERLTLNNYICSMCKKGVITRIKHGHYIINDDLKTIVSDGVLDIRIVSV